MRIEWKTIPGFSRYEVSNNGRVRSKGRWATQSAVGAKRRWLKPKERKLVNSTSTYEGKFYKGVDLTRDGHGTERRRMHVHVLVLLAFVGPRPSPKHVGMHRNDVPDDNRVQNLKWGTYAENTKAAYARGRKIMVGRKGEANPTATLTDDKVRRLVRMVRNGIRTKDIAASLDISPSTVSNIKAGKVWSHITGW